MSFLYFLWLWTKKTNKNLPFIDALLGNKNYGKSFVYIIFNFHYSHIK